MVWSNILAGSLDDPVIPVLLGLVAALMVGHMPLVLWVERRKMAQLARGAGCGGDAHKLLRRIAIGGHVAVAVAALVVGRHVDRWLTAHLAAINRALAKPSMATIATASAAPCEERFDPDAARYVPRAILTGACPDAAARLRVMRTLVQLDVSEDAARLLFPAFRAPHENVVLAVRSAGPPRLDWLDNEALRHVLFLTALGTATENWS